MLQTQKNLFHNHCEDYFKYYRPDEQLKSTELSAVPTPKSSSSRHVDLQRLPLDCSNLSCHLTVAYEIRSETFSNINWTSLTDLR